MNTLVNNNFIIASKTRGLIKDLSNMIEIIPKRYYYQKNKLLSYSYDMLECIYIINDADFDTKLYMQKLVMDISLIDFTLGMFLDKKLISKGNSEMILYRLTEISKMTSVWLHNIRENQNES